MEKLKHGQHVLLSAIASMKSARADVYVCESSLVEKKQLDCGNTISLGENKKFLQ